MDSIRIKLPYNNTFEKEFDGKKQESVFNMVRDYFRFYDDYRDKHDISARAWRFPTIEFNGKQTDVSVTPNGNWDRKDSYKPLLFAFNCETGKHEWLDFVTTIQKILEEIA